MLGSYQMYPTSTSGSIHINSKDPFSAPDFDTAYLSNPLDMPSHVWAYKILRDITRRMPAYRGELAAAAPKFADDSPARCISQEEAIALHKEGKYEKLVYSKEDDAAIEQWMRENVGTTWHSMATCPMKAKAKGGVVDPRLNVYGTQGLKLAGK